MSGACKPASIVFDRSARPTHSLHRPRTIADRYAGVCEPRLHELMDDPILLRLMASDGVSRSELDAVVMIARSRLGGQ